MKENYDLKHVYDISLFNIDDFDVLLHEILKQIRFILQAEAGTIYIHDEDCLTFNVFQNDALSYEKIYTCYQKLKDVTLSLKDEKKYLAVESFNSKKIILIDDVYDNDQYDFLGVKEFDKQFAYKTKSLITMPLIHPIENKTLGVIQLLNKKVDGEYKCFNKEDKEMLSMAGSFIAISILKAQVDVEKLEKLNKRLESANEYLEQRIQLEMSENEKKNAIIFHQSKLVSMGEMIGNIAHQWRQPLSTISTISSGLSLKLELNNFNNSEAQEQLRHIVDTTQHLSHTIDDFRNFYKIDKTKSYFNISKSIHKCLSILSASISMHRIQVIPNIDEKLEFYGLENEFIQAILNIISNGKDALIHKRKEGELRLLFIDVYYEDERVFISIKDNARGISSKNLLKIFDQNFTTKEESGGTGLGLFMTKEIIEKHMRGKLEVSNTTYTYNDLPHKGALFLLSFDANT